MKPWPLFAEPLQMRSRRRRRQMRKAIPEADVALARINSRDYTARDQFASKSLRRLRSPWQC